jgi:AraC-like DNA-binding protein
VAAVRSRARAAPGRGAGLASADGGGRGALGARARRVQRRRPLSAPTAIFVWPGHALYVGPALEAGAHAHHALQISIALGGTLAVAIDGGTWRRVAGMVIAPDVRHRIRAAGGLAQVYLDPEDDACRWLRQAVGAAGGRTLAAGALAGVQPALARARRPAGTRDDARRAATAVLDAVAAALGATPANAGDRGSQRATAPAPRPIDGRVRRVLRRLRTAPGRPVPLADLAADARLSPGRLGHLFRAEIGIPIRRYVLWLRIIAAIERMAAGRSLTAVAHDAGFADSAHLSRVFRRTFATAPSAFVRAGRVILAPNAPQTHVR